MHPEIHEEFLTVLLAVVVSFTLEWLWHGPLFGKTWMRLMNYPKDMKPTMGMMASSLLLALLATFLTVHVLVYTTNVWRPSVWGIGVDKDWFFYGFMSGFFIWLGFYLPVTLHSVAWEGRTWRLAAFNLLYQFVDLQAIAMIVAYMYAH
jgi:hypothetical protein